MARATDPKVLQALQDRNVQKVKLAVTDIDGILRGKVVSIEKFKSIAEKGFGFCDVVFGWDSSDKAYENASVTGWHSGYPDATATIDIQTQRFIPWENELPFFLADFSGTHNQLHEICPRTLLKKIHGQAIQQGFLPYFSQEFEWFNFVDNRSALYQDNFTSLQPLTPGMFGYSILRSSQQSAYFNELFDSLLKMKVPLEGLHTETGPGVYEAAIEYAEILEAADRAVIFKNSVKEIASRSGIIASFMAKWNEQLPGCSGHVHQSLWSADGNTNLFYDQQGSRQISGLMENYIAGQLHCLPFILPMYAPSINSYKRLVEGAWAPTTVTWGIDNRTTALRVLAGSSQSTRLETRVVGSDANPYLAMAACLASGLYGIRHQMKLETAPTEGNGYADTSQGKLPSNLWQATEAMKQSPIAAELFGPAFVQHFIATREWEWKQYAKAVTDWELRRYFEII